jgi:hypothetical protein
MKETIDVRGASGAVYRFTRHSEDQPLSASGGAFIYARDSADSCEILFLGEAPNLMTGAKRRWDQAVREHGAGRIFTRLNVTERARLEELGDMLSALAPPMNGPESQDAA